MVFYLQKLEGMEMQVNALSNLGLLWRRFIGMITDSRSFMSYPRYEYLPHVVQLIGRDIENGEIRTTKNLSAR